MNETKKSMSANACRDRTVKPNVITTLNLDDGAAKVVSANPLPMCHIDTDSSRHFTARREGLCQRGGTSQARPTATFVGTPAFTKQTSKKYLKK